jgi:trans-aconitate methyltransferase
MSMTEYRWNNAEVATGYDAAAPLVHPYYAEVQDAIFSVLPLKSDADALLVDAGGGSGRFLERFLERFPHAKGVIIDQSEAFLTIARERLARFGQRAAFVCRRLQDDWSDVLDGKPQAIVSMSAIHHLEPREKQALYARCWERLAPGGVFANGDEVRDPDDDLYRAALTKWAGHMQELATAGRVSAPMAETLLGWRKRNVERFDAPRVSGDDCHETVEAQLGYLRDAGFEPVRAAWQNEMWAVMVGRKP